MLAIVLVMAVIMVLCAGVVAYVAFPHRGTALPFVPQFGDAMRKGVDALPTLEDSQARN